MVLRAGKKQRRAAVFGRWLLHCIADVDVHFFHLRWVVQTGHLSTITLIIRRTLHCTSSRGDPQTETNQLIDLIFSLHIESVPAFSKALECRAEYCYSTSILDNLETLSCVTCISNLAEDIRHYYRVSCPWTRHESSWCLVQLDTSFTSISMPTFGTSLGLSTVVGILKLPEPAEVTITFMLDCRAETCIDNCAHIAKYSTSEVRKSRSSATQLPNIINMSNLRN
jgi:hypothetical protein